MSPKRLTTPLTNEAILDLHAGDEVLITGTIYTARDAAHKRMMATLKEGQPLPVDFRGQIIYCVGPCPARPGEVIGSAGPTTSLRVDPYTPTMLDHGAKLLIGKGYRSDEVKRSLQSHTPRTPSPSAARRHCWPHTSSRPRWCAYPDLATEAIRKLEVRDFPVVIVNDAHGVDFFEAGVAEWRGKATPV